MEPGKEEEFGLKFTIQYLMLRGMVTSVSILLSEKLRVGVCLCAVCILLCFMYILGVCFCSFINHLDLFHLLSVF